MENLYKEIIKNEVVPALGCTEPVAIAYTVSKAVEHINGKIMEIIITVDQDTQKNAMGVLIPNSGGRKGVPMATALGLYANPNKGLECLSQINEENIESAHNLVNSGIIHNVIREELGLFISAKIVTDQSIVESTVMGGHTNLVSLKINGEEQKSFSQESDFFNGKVDYQDTLKKLSLDEMILLSQNIDESDIEYLKKGIAMQFEIGEYFQAKFIEEYEKIKKSYSGPMYTKELSDILTRCTSATYARMSGVNKPVMSSGGSGNQGIIAILLPYLYATEVLGIDKDERIIYEAIALSNILNSYVKCYTGAVSSMCGCSIAAGEGAISAMLYLQGLNEEIGTGINNMIASSGGVLCDGAKIGCYNKVASAVVNVMNAVSQSINSLGVSVSDGIIGNDPLESIRNLSQIANEGGVTRKIIPILLSK